MRREEIINPLLAGHDGCPDGQFFLVRRKPIVKGYQSSFSFV